MSEETRKAEAKDDKTAHIEFRGETFTVSRNYDDWPVEFVESIEEGKAVGICRGALGPKQWRLVQSMNLTMGQLAPLADGITKALGFADVGESQASSD